MSTTVQQVPTGTYLVDPVHSNAGFSIKAAGLSGFRGTFGAYDARLEDGALSGSGALESLQIAEEQLKGALLSPMFFDAARFPSVAFTSGEVRPATDGSVELAGELTMHGVTAPSLLAAPSRPARTPPGASVSHST